MNIAIIGSGGREHALCQKFSESKKISLEYDFEIKKDKKINVYKNKLIFI